MLYVLDVRLSHYGYDGYVGMEVVEGTPLLQHDSQRFLGSPTRVLIISKEGAPLYIHQQLAKVSPNKIFAADKAGLTSLVKYSEAVFI